MKVTRINPETLYNSVQYGFSHATLQEGGRTLHMAGQVALDSSGSLVGASDLRAQLRQSLANLRTVLAALDAQPSNIVRLRTYVVNHTPDKVPIVMGEIGAFFGGEIPPPNTFIGVVTLALPDFLIEIEATAALD
jgi:enamine deaminase RidA (YjgF/YER057c/UK114 family)